MKKFYIVAGLFLFMGASSLQAQSVIESDAALHERVTALTRRIAETAKLNEGQYLEVKRLNLVMMTEMQTIKVRYASNTAKMDEQLAELQARYDWDLASVLRPQQLTAYNASKISTIALR